MSRRKHEQFQLLHALAVRPVFLHWVIFYTSSVLAGLHAATIWSCNRREIVEAEFLNDFHELRPVVVCMDFVEGQDVPARYPGA